MPMRHTVRSAAARVLATAAVLTMGGCATKADIRDLRTELRDLAIRQDSLMSELRRETLNTQDTVRDQSTQLFDFRGAIARQLQDISQSLTRLEAMVGENQRGIAGVRDQMANMRRTPVSVTPGVGDSASAESGAAPATQPTGDAQAVFNAAVTQFNNGSLTTARLGFEQFLQMYPNNSLAPDAQFYIADILQKNDRNEDALAAFQKIRELYPTSPKVPEALYRVALLQIDMGKKADARTTLQLIINTWPEAEVTDLARDKLKEIR
jgi:tol-pal system protein YbgF